MDDGVWGLGSAAGARVGPHLLHLLSDGDAALTRRVRLRVGTVPRSPSRPSPMCER
jgi:hypothetical protein